MITQKGEDGTIYHISTNDVIAIRDLVMLICQQMGVRFEDHVEIVGERLGKDSAYHLDSTKLREELGWSDHISLNQGIQECIDWVKANLTALKEQPMDYVHKP
jgi:dTDP-glucose 4,6-dehydratase